MTRLALEIGGSKCQLARGRADGRIDSAERLTVDPAAGRDGALDQIARLIGRQNLDGVDVICVGYGGPVDPATGVVVTNHHMPGWDGFALGDWLSESFGREVRIENDTNCAGLAEATLGAGAGGRRVVYSNLGSGVGGAIVLDGKVHTGPSGAGEIGHSYLWDPDQGRYVICEQLCSGWALDRRARDEARAGRLPRLLELAGGNPQAVDAKLLGRALEREHETRGLDEDSLRASALDVPAIEEAGRLLNELTWHYSVALANVVSLINPDRIVLGGGLSLIGQPFLTRIETRLRTICFEPYRDNWTLSPAALGEEVVLAGALML